MVITTDRLILTTPLGTEHTDDLVRLHADANVAYWNAGAWSEADARRFAVEMAGRWSAGFERSSLSPRCTTKPRGL